ncbi:hypothetical protein CPL67_28335, partial [Klebsiella pneumoniae]
ALSISSTPGEAIYERDFHLRDGVTVREDYLGIDHLALGMGLIYLIDAGGGYLRARFSSA